MKGKSALARGDVTGTASASYMYQPVLTWNHNIWNYGRLELVRGAN